MGVGELTENLKKNACINCIFVFFLWFFFYRAKRSKGSNSMAPEGDGVKRWEWKDEEGKISRKFCINSMRSHPMAWDPAIALRCESKKEEGIGNRK